MYFHMLRKLQPNCHALLELTDRYGRKCVPIFHCTRNGIRKGTVDGVGDAATPKFPTFHSISVRLLLALSLGSTGIFRADGIKIITIL